MKKLMLSSLLVVGFSAGALAQGTILANNQNNTGVFNGAGGVAFNPGTTTGNPVYSSAVTQNGLIFTLDAVNTWGHNGNGGPAGNQLLGTDVSFQILGGASAGSATSPVFTLTGAGIAGDNAQWGQVIVSGTQTVPGTSAASPVFLNIFFWEGSTFSSYAAAQAGGDYVGTTGVFQNNAGGGATPASTLTGMPDVLLQQVPEPSIFALAGLGAAALMTLRRRK